MGVAWAPREVTSIKVCTYFGECRDDAVAAALDWTVTNGGPRQVINMSLTVTPTIALAEVVARSYNAGNLLVAAAGNNSDVATNNYPAAYSQVIMVTGTLPDDTAAGWMTCPNEASPYYTRSNFSADAELSAPFYAKNMWLNGTYETHCGTSMATPHVSGVAALLWTKETTLTRDQVRNRLQYTAIDLGASGRDPYFGYGRVDAFNALFPVGVYIDGPVYIDATGNYTWSATASGGTGSYSYQWYFSDNGGATWHLASSSQTQTLYVQTGDPGFSLQVYVTSGSMTSSAEIGVAVAGGCGGLGC